MPLSIATLLRYNPERSANYTRLGTFTGDNKKRFIPDTDRFSGTYVLGGQRAGKFWLFSLFLLIAALPFMASSPMQQNQTGPIVLAATPQPIGLPGSWHMIFEDEFNAPSLNTSIWTSGWFGTGITGPINSAETTCYDSAQVTEPGDGYLQMHLIPQQETCKGSTRPYTGSVISTNPSDGVAGHTGFQFTYGYVEFKADLPDSRSGAVANWPGTFSTGQNWPTDGENDTAEGLGGQVCYHFHSPSGAPGGCASGNYTGWHTFGSDWEPGVVTYYYDGIQVGKITTGITSSPQYLVLDNSQGSYGGSTRIPSDMSMRIKYVRVWQRVRCSVCGKS